MQKNMQNKIQKYMVKNYAINMQNMQIYEKYVKLRRKCYM
jgi:hypothetical protein